MPERAAQRPCGIVSSAAGEGEGGEGREGDNRDGIHRSPGLKGDCKCRFA